MRQIIYKLDSKGKLRYLIISTSGYEIVQESGLVGGNPVVNISTCEAKNVGKANATTPTQQAVIEATAKIKKKLEEGYYLTIEEAQGGTLVQPMLAKSFDDEEDKITYPCYVQPKLDGMRNLKEKSKMTSRGNKSIDTMNHIAQELLQIVPTLDGELYAHGLSFQENMKLIKKYREGQSEQVKYHVYDLISDEPFWKRYAMLTAIIDIFKPNNIVLVPTYQIKDKQDLIRHHAMFTEQGYEGTMIRWGDEGYKANGRSSNLLKYKDFKDMACTIIDVEPSEKRPTQGHFICVDKKGRKFGTGMRFSHSEKEEILTNKSKYIDKTAEIRFFEFTDDGLPRFPVCVGLRLDK